MFGPHEPDTSDIFGKILLGFLAVGVFSFGTMVFSIFGTALAHVLTEQFGSMQFFEYFPYIFGAICTAITSLLVKRYA